MKVKIGIGIATILACLLFLIPLEAETEMHEDLTVYGYVRTYGKIYPFADTMWTCGDATHRFAEGYFFRIYATYCSLRTIKADTGRISYRLSGIKDSSRVQKGDTFLVSGLIWSRKDSSVYRTAETLKVYGFSFARLDSSDRLATDTSRTYVFSYTRKDSAIYSSTDTAKVATQLSIGSLVNENDSLLYVKDSSAGQGAVYIDQRGVGGSAYGLYVTARGAPPIQVLANGNVTGVSVTSNSSNANTYCFEAVTARKAKGYYACVDSGTAGFFSTIYADPAVVIRGDAVDTLLLFRKSTAPVAHIDSTGAYHITGGVDLNRHSLTDIDSVVVGAMLWARKDSTPYQAAETLKVYGYSFARLDSSDRFATDTSKTYVFGWSRKDSSLYSSVETLKVYGYSFARLDSSDRFATDTSKTYVFGWSRKDSSLYSSAETLKVYGYTHVRKDSSIYATAETLKVYGYSFARLDSSDRFATDTSKTYVFGWSRKDSALYTSAETLKVYGYTHIRKDSSIYATAETLKVYGYSFARLDSSDRFATDTSKTYVFSWTRKDSALYSSADTSRIYNRLTIGYLTHEQDSLVVIQDSATENGIAAVVIDQRGLGTEALCIYGTAKKEGMDITSYTRSGIIARSNANNATYYALYGLPEADSLAGGVCGQSGAGIAGYFLSTGTGLPLQVRGNTNDTLVTFMSGATIMSYVDSAGNYLASGWKADSCVAAEDTIVDARFTTNALIDIYFIETQGIDGGFWQERGTGSGDSLFVNISAAPGDPRVYWWKVARW